jgi:hemerythrin-like metal-binding protein
MIDADHQLLVSLVNQLHDSREEGQSRDVVCSVLTVLVEYLTGHFHREELLMARIGYPEQEAHSAEHHRISTRSEACRADYLAGRHAAADDLVALLKGWLTGHFLTADRRYQPFVREIHLTAEELLAPVSALSEEPAAESGWPASAAGNDGPGDAAVDSGALPGRQGKECGFGAP